MVAVIVSLGTIGIIEYKLSEALGVPGTIFKREQAEKVPQGKGGNNPMATEEYVRRIASGYVKRLGQYIRVHKAILTGSWAKGSHLEDSDVDLIVVSDDSVEMPLPARLSYLQKRWTSRLPLEAFGYTTAEFRNLRRNSTYVRDALRHGQVVWSSPDRGRVRRLLKLNARPG